MRVVEAAKARAALLGEDAPEWIDASKVSTKPAPFDPAELRGRWVVPALSVLATCVLAFLLTKLTLLYNESLERQRQEEIAEFKKKQDEQDLLAVFDKKPDNNQADLGSEPASSIVGNLLDESNKGTEPSDADSFANKDEKAIASDKIRGSHGETKTESQPKEMSASAASANSPEAAGSKLDAELSDASMLAENRSAADTNEAVNRSAVASNKASNTEDSKPKNPLQKATAKMMAVYEVTLDEAAREGELINVYLQKHGLGSVEDLVLGDEEIASVLKSGIVGPADTQGESQVLVLKGTASMLSEFYDDLLRSYEDFPRLRMNAVMDDSVNVIEKQMQTMLVTDSKGAAGRLGSSGSSGLVSSFASGSSKFFDIPMEQRKLDKRREPGRDLNPISYVILIIRSPK
ncbi:MAG: hypothetical protein MUC83_14285 [Pirellula sp.]|nr:hypothetical protein [Pirellula sp.]